MKKETTRLFKLRANLWLYPGETANWHFLTVPKKETALIAERFKEFTRGWGSLPVSVTIRKTKWQTSIFPDKKSGTYLLPVKAEIRRKEGLEAGDAVVFSLTILP